MDYADLVKRFFEVHDPTQGMRQGNDIGTQYRSAIYFTTPEQEQTARDLTKIYGDELSRQRLGDITTEVKPAPTYYYAEDYHQQYLAKNPNGYRARTRWTAAMMSRLSRKDNQEHRGQQQQQDRGCYRCNDGSPHNGCARLPCPLDGCPDRVLTAQACLHPLGTGFLLCATALGEYIESLVCQRSQRSRGIASACDAIELVSPHDNFLLQLGCRAPHGGVEYRGEGAGRTVLSTNPSGRGRCG